MSLRDYQKSVVSRTGQSLRQGARRVMITMPTGSGKGNVISYLALAAAGQGQRSVVSAPRREIILDLQRRMSGQGFEIGILAPWAPYQPDAPIQVASDMTLPRRLDQLPEPAWFFPDECHHTVAAGYAPVFDRWTGARTVGLTATPWRLDGQGFDGIFDDLIAAESPRWFMDQGYLVEADIYAPTVPDLARLSGRSGDFATADLEELLEKSGTIGDAIQSFSRYVRPGGTAVAFCVSKRHAQMTADAFTAAGVPAEVLVGEDSGDSRNGKLARLDGGQTRVLCTVDVVSEGSDLPSIDAAILLRPTKSLSLFLQQVGRVLRPVYAVGFDLGSTVGRLAAIAAGPKHRAVVLDHAGNVLRHGHPAARRDWSLKPENLMTRSDRLTAVGEDISVRQCGSCYGVFETAAVCPYCATDQPVDERIPRWKAGELRLIEEKELEAKRQAARAAERGEKTLQDWIKIGQERGYKPAWAYQRHALRQKRRRAA